MKVQSAKPIGRLLLSGTQVSRHVLPRLQTRTCITLTAPLNCCLVSRQESRQPRGGRCPLQGDSKCLGSPERRTGEGVVSRFPPSGKHALKSSTTLLSHSTGYPSNDACGAPGAGMTVTVTRSCEPAGIRREEMEVMRVKQHRQRICRCSSTSHPHATAASMMDPGYGRCSGAPLLTV